MKIFNFSRRKAKSRICEANSTIQSCRFIFIGQMTKIFTGKNPAKILVKLQSNWLYGSILIFWSFGHQFWPILAQNWVKIRHRFLKTPGFEGYSGVFKTTLILKIPVFGLSGVHFDDLFLKTPKWCKQRPLLISKDPITSLFFVIFW